MSTALLRDSLYRAEPGASLPIEANLCVTTLVWPHSNKNKPMNTQPVSLFSNEPKPKPMDCG